MKKYHIAVVGATGAVGTEMLKILEERDFPIESIRLFAHESEAGKKITFKGSEFTVEKVDEDNIKGIDIAFFAAGPVSKVLAPVFVKNGAVVIDNGSSFRLDPSVPGNTRNKPGRRGLAQRHHIKSQLRHHNPVRPFKAHLRLCGCHQDHSIHAPGGFRSRSQGHS